MRDKVDIVTVNSLKGVANRGKIRVITQELSGDRVSMPSAHRVAKISDCCEKLDHIHDQA